MKMLLGLTAILEAATGLGLMIAPETVARLLLGSGLSGAGAAVGRVGGLAFLSLGLACWPGRAPAHGAAPAFRAMLTYNLLVTIYLASLGAGADLVGPLLWPAAVLHAVLTLLLGNAWFKGRHAEAPRL